jgi:polyferredoxin
MLSVNRFPGAWLGPGMARSARKPPFRPARDGARPSAETVRAAIARGPTLLQRVASVRRLVQVSVGALVWVAVSNGWIGLLALFVVASVAGAILGKFFCRWMCPLGAVMETLMGAGDADGRQRALYGYFKVGCPISWVQGLLNRASALRLEADGSLCTHCDRCDRACYVAQLADGRSLHDAAKLNASTHFSCSRCLQCVGACPTGALGLSPVRIGRR